MAKNEITVKAVRSDNKVFNFCDSDWCILANGLEGIDNAGFEIFTAKKGFGDGDIVTGIRATSREVTISCRTKAGSDRALQRYKAISFFNHTFIYTLYFTYQGQTRYADNVRLQEFSLPSEKQTSPLNMKVQFLSPDPYLKGSESYTNDYSDKIKLMYFPYVVTDTNLKKDALSAYTSVSSKPIYYGGTQKSPLTISIKFSGAGNELIINFYNSDGDHALITINYQFVSGDVVVVTPNSVTLNGTAMSPQYYADSISGMSKLYVTFGDNSLTMSDADGNQNFAATYSWSATYMGM